MAPLTIAPATPQDTSEISALLARAYAGLEQFYPVEILKPVMPLFATCNHKLVASGRYFVLREDGAVRAVGGWSEDAPGTASYAPARGHIRHVGVDPKAGGRGFGRDLLEAVEADAVQNGMTELEAFANVPAVPFYLALGYTRLGSRTELISGQYEFDGVDLRKRL
ncbi:GNAT family N-acetyltransferase [Pelagibacterium sp.]|uniref:GNAT family N-acetyltransferase n=1 Tax=Pelagibacterium sp. TaxID=1967288 RepID=UPI003A956170